MIPSSSRRSPVYTGTGTVDTYDFDFKVYAETDVAVEVTGTDGVVLPLEYGTDFTVTLNADQDNFPGGSITLTAGDLTTGYELVALGDSPYSQTTQLPNGGTYNARVVERAMDRLSVQIQQVREILRRALIVPSTDSEPENLPNAAARAAQFLAFDADGNPVASSGTGADGGLRTDLAASTGTTLVAYDGGNVRDVLDGAKSLVNYTALRAYTGRATSVRLTAAGIAGQFRRDDADVATADNGATVIVTSAGVRFKRAFDGAVHFNWFEPTGNGVTDDTAKLQTADTYAAGISAELFIDASKTYSVQRFVPAGRLVSSKAVTFTADTIPVRVAVGGQNSAAAEVRGYIDENSTQVLAAANFTSLVSATAVTSGSEVVLTRTGAGASASIPVITLPSGDWIAYIKARMSSNAAGQVVNIQLGSGGGLAMALSLGYDWVAGAAAAGTASVTWAGGNKVLLTGRDFTQEHYFVVHYDSNFTGILVYLKNAATGEYTFLGAVDGAFVATTEFRVTWAASGSVGLALTLGSTRMFCKPNYISIGDSICKGANGFDPNPATADKNFASCWQSYARITGLENTLIVNKGIGGETSIQIGARIATNVVAHQPRFCFLHLSTNDYAAALTYGARTSNTQASIDALRTSSIRVILLSAIYPNLNAPGYPDNSNYYRNYVSDGSFDSLNGYDQYIPFMDEGLGDDDNDLSTAYGSGDGVHPTTAGYAIIGALVAAQMNGSTKPRIHRDLAVPGSIYAGGLIYGRLASAMPFGWKVLKYTNGASPAWSVFNSSTNAENTGMLSVEDGTAPSEVNLHFSRLQIIPGSFSTFSTSGVFCVARLVDITATGGGVFDFKARYVVRKQADGATPTGVELNLMQFYIKY